MWPLFFEDRLRAWHDLRQNLGTQLSADQLQQVNHWWWRVPMINYCLHWNDTTTWPGPWELLTLDGYCNISRALGMVYTIALVSPPLRDKLVLLHGHEATLVMIKGRDHVLNWDPSSVDSIDLADFALIDKLNCSKILDWEHI
jgi:hypothetical protein